MKETLKISIIDDNQYFTSGLRHLLADFYLTKNTRVRFIDEKVSKPSIDILFHANRYGIPGVYYRYLHSTAKPLVFAICDKNEKCHVRKDGILYRHQSMNLVLNMVEQARSIDPHSSDPVSDVSLAQTITHREYEVLGYLKQGRSLTEAANYMNLSVKTVSAHKRSVMKKLNFRRNSELLYWMIQGGLIGHTKVMR
ncbi:response regulator transcription factor [Serratia fonticola]|uniref:helix-turn-helix transcriptional regulator n=1 Tax=Serratia fonticola TaxID=47917 RepID=UPI003AAECA7F